ncbi:MAG: hypothetical protein NXI31_14980 [bacterium]|nr:hypothetical protein [bacterium]
MHPLTNRAAKLSLASLATLALLTGCSDSSPGGDPEPEVNQAPSMLVPNQLSGSSPSYSLTLAVSGTETLTFTATDPELDALTWQILPVSGEASAVGLSVNGGANGTTFVLEIATVTAPASHALVLVVQDTRGNATAIDLVIVRSGPPSLTSVTPTSAFATASQPVTITGEALQLGGAATTTVRFSGALGNFTTVLDDMTVQTSTPTTLGAGPIAISVNNGFGSATLPSSAFTAYRNPPIFFAADAALDSGNGSAAVLARDDTEVHAVFLEGGNLVHRASADSGATWNAPQTLSGSETPTEPQVVVDGQNVTVVWVGDGTTILARNSSDGGGTFDPAQVIDGTAAPANRPRIAASGDRRYVAWLAGNPGLGLARVMASASSDAGANWATPMLVDDGGAVQGGHEIDCHDNTAWLVFTDERQGPGVPGAYTSTTVDGGTTWSAATLRSAANVAVSAPRLCGDMINVHTTWLVGGVLRYSASTNAGGAWSQAVTLQDTSNGAVTEPAITCDEDRVFAIYVAGGNSVWVAAITATGSLPQQTQLSTASVVAGGPQIYHHGNYVFAAWRSDDIGSGAARIQHALSTDVGQNFSSPVGLGDGTAAQQQPVLLVEGASMLLCWLDSRGAMPALFVNRNQP